MKKALTIILTAAMILSLGACGKDHNTGGMTEDVEAVRNDNNMDNKETEMDAGETGEKDTTDKEEGIVPWDEMAPLSIATLPIGDKYNVLDKVTFFPDILFPTEYDVFDGGFFARLDGKEYSVYAYVESHWRNVESSGSDLYYAEVGDYIIYVRSALLSDIQLKNNAGDYQISISPVIMGANDELKEEYIIKNCDYIKEQLETLDHGTDIT